MRIVSVSAEFSPWCKTGGLGDVAAALPAALTDVDPAVEYLSIVPLYRVAREALRRAERRLKDLKMETRHVVDGRRYHVRYFELEGEPRRRRIIFAACDALLSGPDLYSAVPVQRAGVTPYTPSEGTRFAVLALAALRAAPRLMNAPVDVFHVHDWHAGLVPWVLAHRGRTSGHRPKSMLTIHNLAYQGWFPAAELPEFSVDGDDGVHFLKRGVECADRVTTVSPSYADEVRTQAFGCGMHDLLAERDVLGILNGIDLLAWDSTQDNALTAGFSAEDLAGRSECRASLHAELGWDPDDNTMLLGVVSRLDPQKGLDWVAKSVPKFAKLGARLVLLGTGDKGLESEFRALSSRYPEVCAAWLSFDLDRARRIFAGSDAILVPSRFEPCGLTQLYGMRYGSVPIVNPVGGLKDTVMDVNTSTDSELSGTGFHMRSDTARGLCAAVGRAARIFTGDPEQWRSIQARGMRADWSWSRSAAVYLEVMREMVAEA